MFAGKDCDSSLFARIPRTAGAEVAILLRSNRGIECRYDRALYCTHGVVEHNVECIKQFREVSTRYGKITDSYLVFMSLAGAFGSYIQV